MKGKWILSAIAVVIVMFAVLATRNDHSSNEGVITPPGSNMKFDNTSKENLSVPVVLGAAESRLNSIGYTLVGGSPIVVNNNK